ncbi:hypothetical protein JCM3766R1_003825 [Sporobolomyces carnicolor]
MSPTEWFSARIARAGIRRWWVLTIVVTVIVWCNYHRHRSPGPSLSHGEDDRDRDHVPRVDRTALEKLRLLEIHEGIDDEHDHSVPTTKNHNRVPLLDRPPAVNEVPEVEKLNPLAPTGGRFEKVPAAVLDREVCGAAAEGHGCQFVVAAWLGEQETKAQQHLYQLGLVALATNRTLVLPNVSKSRLGTCYRNPFTFYYQPDAVSSLGIKTISQDDFLVWSLRRDPPATAQVVSVVNARPGVYPDGGIEIDSFADAFAPTAKPNRNLCLRSPRSKLDFNAHSPLAIYPPEGYHKSEAGRLAFGQSVVDTLESGEVAASSSRRSGSRHFEHALPDVFAFNYEMRFPILTPEAVAAHLDPSSSARAPEAADDDERESDSSTPLVDVPALPFSHFAYADTWSTLADVISSRLGAYIAIHWRTETLSPQNLVPCADSLVDRIFALKQEYPEIETVYLATDYPIEQLDPSFGPLDGGGNEGVVVAHSGTFAKAATDQHDKAMKKFLTTFARRAKRLGGSISSNRKGLRLTTFAKEQNQVSLDPRVSSDLPPKLLDELIDMSSRVVGVVEGREQVETPSTLDLGRVDPGLLGILDKLVVSRAQLFLTGVAGVGSSTEGACAKLSSFTQQLVAKREELVRLQQEREQEGDDGADARTTTTTRRPGTLWNTVQHWSLDGQVVD